MRRLIGLIASAALLRAVPAAAHAAGARDHHARPGWTLDPWIVAPLVLAALLFARGWWRLYARSGQGSAALRRRAALFATGLLVLAAALVSPLHEAGERSFAAHIFEHELLMLVGAPLLVLAEPLAVMLWAFPPSGRRALAAAVPVIATPWRWLTGAVTATVLQAVALWLWHAPALFDRALASEGWHVAQHLSFLVAALLFWTAMLHRRTAAGIAALCLVATAIVSGALGALMAFATSPWYAGYASLGMAPFGLSPAEDQQLAGLLMWVPGGLVHAGAALLLMRRLLADPRLGTSDAR
ncbi:cytochrome c oxidase assembly factor CtaG [Sphingomonas sp. BE138]|uniref:cytochrome c oxidase assembly protein n=1 Tax=Sphingomonas sp. BE138 TaxID=2817845 RepID=UPI002865C1FC|nr:cytochrome c oxidase assembly protein [Sphingomonas sp. BE138]MDR6787145.1 cytochrome c oxidase assembly factor CtaG [Sphingomonas sp. BE138]